MTRKRQSERDCGGVTEHVAKMSAVTKPDGQRGQYEVSKCLCDTFDRLEAAVRGFAASDNGGQSDSKKRDMSDGV